MNWGVDGRKMGRHHWSNVLNIWGVNPKGGEAGCDSRIRSTWKSKYAKNSIGREGDGKRAKKGRGRWCGVERRMNCF